MSEFRIDQIKSQDASRGPDIAGITTFTGTSGIVMPSGDTRYRYSANDGNIVTDGLVLYLDAGKEESFGGDGTTWRDLSGNSNNGTLVNGVGYDYEQGGSLSFDGVNDYVTSTSSGFAFGTGNFAVEGWAYVTSHINYRILATTRPNNGGYPDAWHIGCDANGTILLYSNAFNLQSASNAVPVNTWFHWCCTRINSVASLLINASVVASGTVTNNYARTVLGIGNFPINISEPWSGRISNIKIYNRALTAAEVQQNYNALKERYGL